MAAVLFLSSSVFSAQTHLFMVGSWKESKTVCQDILYFSEPSISQIRSVKTQKHTINSDKEHRDEDLLDYTTLLIKNNPFLLRWFPLTFPYLCFDSASKQWCYWTVFCLNHTIICKPYFSKVKFYLFHPKHIIKC